VIKIPEQEKAGRDRDEEEDQEHNFRITQKPGVSRRQWTRREPR
jgi:hypothetical protein